MIVTVFDANRKLTTQLAIDRVTLDEITQAATHWIQQPDFDPNIPVLWDFTDGSPYFSFTEVFDFSVSQEAESLADQINQRRTQGKTAWVVTTGLGRSMIEIIYDQRKWHAEWKVFMRRDEALIWLGIEPNL